MAVALSSQVLKSHPRADRPRRVQHAFSLRILAVLPLACDRLAIPSPNKTHADRRFRHLGADESIMRSAYPGPSRTLVGSTRIEPMIRSKGHER